MKFAVKTVTCLGCKTPLRSNRDGAVCVNCRPKLPELYQKQVRILDSSDYAQL